MATTVDMANIPVNHMVKVTTEADKVDRAAGVDTEEINKAVGMVIEAGMAASREAIVVVGRQMRCLGANVLA